MKKIIKRSNFKKLIALTLLLSTISSVSFLAADKTESKAGCYHSNQAHSSIGGYKERKKSKMKEWQRYINNNFTFPITVDGSFGPNSQYAAFRAIIELYSRNYPNLYLNYMCDIQGNKTKGYYLTDRAINAINKCTFQQGARNEIIKFFQFSFSCFEICYDIKGVDGIFGPGTKHILTRTTEWSNARRKHATNPNKGVLDYESWHALFQHYYV